MPAIMPVSDLRNYTSVLEAVRPGSPVFLTRNGRGCYAVMEMDDYDSLQAARSLSDELARGRASGEGNGWISEDELRAAFASRDCDQNE